MTQVDFHIHVHDKLAYSCRLLRKIYLKGASVAVIAEPEFLTKLDHWLWQFSPVDFVPHCRAGASLASLAASPIVLTKSLTVAACMNRQVILNLGHDIPTGFEKFERLLEVVTLDTDEILAGRSRWHRYATAGHALKKHIV